MKYLSIFFVLFCSLSLSAQEAKYYETEEGNKHLCGPFSISDLSKDSLFAKWYTESYNEFELSRKNNDWISELKETQVDIYMGTWCGDSKEWVPKFVKLWDELGLSRSQLNFIALYDGEERYKQGPNGEEKGKNIHRVPTFIFKRQNEEYARIVESPRNSLEVDVAQIALGYPSEPNYKGATFLINVLKEEGLEEIYSNMRKYANKAYRLVGSSKELNTLGYVYLRAGQTPEAHLMFYLNTYFFPYDPNVYDSFGEILALQGENEEAIKNYEKVLSLDPDNENAKKQIELLKNL
ncbi:MAG: tetratricopeptide repeat protein [Bacteroidota bacterium]